MQTHEDSWLVPGTCYCSCNKWWSWGETRDCKDWMITHFLYTMCLYIFIKTTFYLFNENQLALDMSDISTAIMKAKMFSLYKKLIPLMCNVGWFIVILLVLFKYFVMYIDLMHWTCLNEFPYISKDAHWLAPMKPIIKSWLKVISSYFTNRWALECKSGSEVRFKGHFTTSCQWITIKFPLA